jgi:hypothetical protein
MAAWDRTSLFRGEGAKVRFRRISPVAARSGDGRLHHPVCRPSPSCDANRWFGELAIYALASRLRASLMEARATKAPRGPDFEPTMDETGWGARQIGSSNWRLVRPH